jgi:type IV secretion system protein VirB10
MAVTEIGDPRLQALFGAKDPRDAGVRPMVRLPRRGLPPVALAVIAVIFGVLLFVILNERRTRETEPSVIARPDSAASAWQTPPSLYVPPAPAPPVQPITEEEQRPEPKPGIASAPAPMPNPEASRIAYVPQPVPQMMPPAPQAQPRTSAGAPLVIDSGAASSDGAVSRTQSSLLGRSSGTVTRMRAGALANRSMTVPQGTLIQAVLETGFDSTQPSFARAVVSRDVRSFDGVNVLIPRGSKLIGEVRSEVAQGQKRAGIIWTRLIRPDGMTITMDSPAVDTVGRGGVAASVNTHFWERFGDALLQTTVGIGSALAQRKAAGTVVILPGATTAAAAQLVPTNTYVPTLTVPAGKSISVFVAHDLDFTASGTPR